MSQPPSQEGALSARLEATIRKAFADAWAQGASTAEAKGIAFQIVRKNYPELTENEFSSLMRNVRKT